MSSRKKRMGVGVLDMLIPSQLVCMIVCHLVDLESKETGEEGVSLPFH